MDMEFIMEGASEDEIFRFEENNEEYTNFEGEVEGEVDGERCGICMDIVIDRGVLDCCQHWFCFTCIDNWASITNLCPLCQHAFQSITCVPVYDTIGGDKFDEDSYSRDDDWSVEGTNNTLSFPSYYIDESAVICLDGDGCKMRSGPEATKTDSNLDTSIACDSCDVWYHAFCVGFDPEGSSENSWLCPRCVVVQVPEEPDYVSTSTYTHQQQAENGNSDCSIEGASSGKMLVSIADDGETALVVSRAQEKQENEESCADQSILNMLKALQPFLSGSVASSPIADLSGVISCEPCLEPDKHEASLSEHACSDLPVDSSAQSDFINIDNQGKEEQKHVDPHEIFSTTYDSFVDGGEAMTEQSKELPASRVLTGEKEGIVSVTGVKRKHINNRDANNVKSKAKVHGKIRLKKAEVDGGNQSRDLKDRANMKDTDSRSNFKKEEVIVDIMDIVQGTDRRRLKKPPAIKSTISSSKEGDNVAGLRVKKIMRRTNDDVVQNLRKEIRDAVGNKSSKDVGENLFDPKLLAAFRAVVTGNTVETKKPHVDMKAKKAIFQKGKVRENLTKKIYGMGGKRKRAWTRDCEIEFWKHRCLKVSKPEKIQTLQSVLSLLRHDTDDRTIKRRKDGESTNTSTNPLLSRLYLADTSLLPRKDDIKPVFALDAPKSDLSVNSPVTSANLSSEKTISVVKSETPSTNLPKSKCTERTPLSGSGGSKTSSQQEKTGVSDVKTDKRKWALELLARKTAVTTKDVGQDTNGDSTLLKGNFPQVSLLPKDMRPVLASARHNKIPTAVRQTQLYRIAENFLKNVNLPAMLRSAETELAVADAINVERDIADRSNSKLVYMNLCSQELLRRAHSKNSNQTTTETSISQTQLAQPDKAEVTNDDDSLDPEVTEALRNAGLLSDTPPSSPCDEPNAEIKEDTNLLEKIDDDNGPENIFEMDSQAGLDIYGDFEYDLEDDDFIGASTLKASSLLQEESKLKVVFSTPCDDNKSKDESLDIPHNENAENIQEAFISYEKSKNIGEVADDVSHFQTSTVDDHEFKEPSLDECEQLYGPDREPMFANPEEMTHVGENGAGYESRASEKTCEPHSEHEHITESLHTSASLPVHEATDENLLENENNASARVDAVANTQSDSPGHQRKDDASANADKQSDSSGHQRKDDANANANKKSDSSSHRRKDDANINANKKSDSPGHQRKDDANKKSDGHPSVTKKVEAYIKEHIRPLCKSGVITVEQYRWSIKKTTEKVMKYHSKDKNANFLVKEGEKVKKLAEQYVETAQQQMPKS